MEFEHAIINFDVGGSYMHIICVCLWCIGIAFDLAFYEMSPRWTLECSSMESGWSFLSVLPRRPCRGWHTRRGRRPQLEVRRWCNPYTYYCKSRNFKFRGINFHVKIIFLVGNPIIGYINVNHAHVIKFACLTFVDYENIVTAKISRFTVNF